MAIESAGKVKEMEKIYNEIIISKTPVSWIHEICAKESQIPKWEITDMLLSERRIPSFRCVLTVNFRGQELTADVEAGDKKAAKHAAATVMLNEGMKLTPRDYYEISGGPKRISAPPSLLLKPPLGPPSVEATAAANKIIIIDEDIKYSAIQDLLLNCQNLKWGEPIYNVLDMVGPPHDRTFEVTCTIKGQTMSEKSKTKKQAKKRVAYKWCIFMQSIGNTESPTLLRSHSRNSSPEPEEESESVEPESIQQLPCSFTYLSFDNTANKNDFPQQGRGGMELKRKQIELKMSDSNSTEVSNRPPQPKKIILNRNNNPKRASETELSVQRPVSVVTPFSVTPAQKDSNQMEQSLEDTKQNTISRVSNTEKFANALPRLETQVNILSNTVVPIGNILSKETSIFTGINQGNITANSNLRGLNSSGSNSTPFSISTNQPPLNASPIRAPLNDSPNRITFNSPDRTPLNVSPNRAPLNVNTDATSLQVNPNRTTLNVSANRAPLNVNTSPTPLQVNPNRTTLNASANRAPLNVNINPTPLQGNPNRTTLNVSSNRAPLNVNTDATPLQVNPSRTTLNISPSRTSLTASPNRIPFNSPNRIPLNVNTNATPLQVNPSRTTLNVSANRALNVGTNETPLKVNPNRTSFYVSPNRTPLTASPNRIPLNVNTNTTPLQVNPNRIKLDVSPNSTPLNVNANRTPHNVNPNRMPINIEQNRNSLISPNKIPRNVNTDATTFNVNPNKTTLNVSSNRTPLSVSPNRTPTNVNANRTPHNVNPNRMPINVSPSRMPINVDPNRNPISINPNRNPIRVDPVRSVFNVSPNMNADSNKTRLNDSANPTPTNIRGNITPIHYNTLENAASVMRDREIQNNIVRDRESPNSISRDRDSSKNSFRRRERQDNAIGDTETQNNFMPNRETQSSVHRGRDTQISANLGRESHNNFIRGRESSIDCDSDNYSPMTIFRSRKTINDLPSKQIDNNDREIPNLGISNRGSEKIFRDRNYQSQNLRDREMQHVLPITDSQSNVRRRETSHNIRIPNDEIRDRERSTNSNRLHSTDSREKEEFQRFMRGRETGNNSALSNTEPQQNAFSSRESRQNVFYQQETPVDIYPSRKTEMDIPDAKTQSTDFHHRELPIDAMDDGKSSDSNFNEENVVPKTFNEVACNQLNPDTESPNPAVPNREIPTGVPIPILDSILTAPNPWTHTPYRLSKGKSTFKSPRAWAPRSARQIARLRESRIQSRPCTRFIYEKLDDFVSYNRSRDRPSYNIDRQSHNIDRPSYNNDRPSFNNDRPSFNNDRPSFNNDRPSFNNDRPSFNNDRPSYNNDRPSYNSDRRSYNNDRPNRGGGFRGNDRPRRLPPVEAKKYFFSSRENLRKKLEGSTEQIERDNAALRELAERLERGEAPIPSLSNRSPKSSSPDSQRPSFSRSLTRLSSSTRRSSSPAAQPHSSSSSYPRRDRDNFCDRNRESDRERDRELEREHERYRERDHGKETDSDKKLQTKPKSRWDVK